MGSATVIYLLSAALIVVSVIRVVVVRVWQPRTRGEFRLVHAPLAAVITVLFAGLAMTWNVWAGLVALAVFPYVYWRSGLAGNGQEPPPPDRG